MKHNDYRAILKCPLCNKKVFAPVAWRGQGKRDGIGVTNPLPRYATCAHKGIIEATYLIKVH